MEYVVIILGVVFTFVLIGIVIRLVLKVMDFMASPDEPQDAEKSKKVVQKNILWMLLGVLLGASLFGE